MKKIVIVLLLLFIKVNASVVVMDADSNRVLYSSNMNERKLIASTTKVMTSLIALDMGSLDDKITIGEEILKVNGSMIYVKQGETFTLNDLLNGLMLQSGNDAAMSIATKYGYDDFIANMNIKAFKLGMYNTNFENPHGLNDETKNYSTAYDLALLMSYAIKNKDFLKITQAKRYKVDKYIWVNKNKLLSEYKYLISGKIGYTKASGQVYVSSARKNGKTLVIASIDETDKFNLHKRLYEEYFEKYEKYKLLYKYFISFKIDDGENNHYYLKKDINVLLRPDEVKNVRLKIDLNQKCVLVLLNEDVIFKEKLYKISYKKRISRIKELLSFR